MKLTSSEMDADDLVQIAFQKLWENHDKLEMVVAKSWLYKTAYRSMIDAFRKDKRNREYIKSQQGDVEYSQTRYENRDLIHRAFEELTEEQKNLIMLRDYEGYSYNEICEITGLTLSNVKIILFRTRKLLKAKLEKWVVNE
ncbi:sigma-70 family RNA polymerase sigma factor [Membranihabitans marinus]